MSEDDYRISEDYVLPSGWNECLYCGEAVEAPAVYCSEECEEKRPMR